MIGLGGFDELGLRNVQSVLFEGSQGGGAVLDGRADAGVEGAVTLGLQVLDDLVLVHLGGDQEACCEGIHAGDVGAEQILGGEDGMGVIRQNMLETSNVKVTEELVNLIQAQRVYEMNSKVLTTVDSMMGSLIQSV